MPNPANHTCKIYNGTGFDIRSVTVLNGLGAVVLRNTKATQGHAILDVSTFATGIYMVRIQTDGGSFIRRLEVLH